MVRFFGVDLPKNKKIAYALTYIHGIGLSSATKIVELAKIPSETRTKNLTMDQIVAIRDVIEDMQLKLEGDLRRFNNLNIKLLTKSNMATMRLSVNTYFVPELGNQCSY